MSDSYQAIYDAVRSRIHGADVGQAVESAMREAFGMASHHMQCIVEEWCRASHEHQRPSAVYKPSISIDGDQWCALYGDNLQDGVAGFGDSPADAMDDFDRNWMTKLEAVKKPSRRAESVLADMGFPSIRPTGSAT